MTRVGIDDTNEAGTGVVGVYLADATGGIADIDNVVRDYLLGDNGDGTFTGRHLLGPPPTVATAGEVSVAVAYSAVYDSVYFSSAADAQDALDAACDAFFASVPVGGVYDGTSRVFPLGGLYRALNAVEGMVNVLLSSPTGSVALTVSQVAVNSSSSPYGTAVPLS